MLRNPDEPVPARSRLLDDDPAKRNLRILGVPGRRRPRPTSPARRDATRRRRRCSSPSRRADAELIRELSDLALDADLDVKVAAAASASCSTAPSASATSAPLTEADLLGRHEIDTDIDAIAGYLTGRRVLVTGAGGSIGSELCRQIYRFAPGRAGHARPRRVGAARACSSRSRAGPCSTRRNLVVADIRDARPRSTRSSREHQPDVVFHAAALKHLPLLEMHPGEAVKTNVLGHADRARRGRAQSGVERFVNISTDKAADPVSVLGYTKRIAERLTAAADGRRARAPT